MFTECWVKVILGEENYKTHYVKMMALKGGKEFANINPTKQKPTILFKNYYIVKEGGQWRYCNRHLEEIKTHDLA